MDELIDRLASDLRPVRPLRPPATRASGWLVAVAILGGLLVLLLGDAGELLDRYRGREQMMALEMAAMLATGVLAIVGAFFVAVPGRSRRWMLAPMAPLGAWLILSGAGCYRLFLENGTAGIEAAHSFDCLIFIIGNSLLIGTPLVRLLSQARPIEPLPVALLGGLGAAALTAFTLSFFHPFAVTFVDLAFHLAAVALVVAVAGLLSRMVGAVTPGPDCG